MIPELERDESTDAAWDDTEPWRQGSVIPSSVAIALSLIEKGDPKFVIIVSHDCDCVAGIDDEPSLEFVLGHEISKIDGSKSFVKSTRRLHIELSKSGKRVELWANTKSKLAKSLLRGVTPDTEWEFSPEEKRTLGRWLAARYDRPSFPSELVRRMRPVRDAFRDAAKQDASQIIGIYIDFDPQTELPAGSMEPYELTVLVVYPSTKPEAGAAAERIVGRIKRSYEKKLKTLSTLAGLQWVDVELTTCEACTDIEFTLQDAQSYYLYSLDDISLRTTPQGTLPSR